MDISMETVKKNHWFTEDSWLATHAGLRSLWFAR